MESQCVVYNDSFLCRSYELSDWARVLLVIRLLSLSSCRWRCFAGCRPRATRTAGSWRRWRASRSAESCWTVSRVRTKWTPSRCSRRFDVAAIARHHQRLTVFLCFLRGSASWASQTSSSRTPELHKLRSALRWRRTSCFLLLGSKLWRRRRYSEVISRRQVVLSLKFMSTWVTTSGLIFIRLCRTSHHSVRAPIKTQIK